MRTHHQHPDDIDIGSIWGALKRSAGKILVGSLAVGLATFAGLSMVTPRYTSDAQIIIGGKGMRDPFRDPKGAGEGTEVIAHRVDGAAVASQVLALKSGDLARKVAAELRLMERPDFNTALPSTDLLGRLQSLLGLGGPGGRESEEELVLTSYKRALQVYQGKETRVITVEFSAAEPQLAADLANKLVEVYRDSLRTVGVTTTNENLERLKPQIAKLAAEVATAEADVERVRASSGNLSIGKESTINQQQIAEISTELSKAKGIRSEAEARSRAAREMMQRGSAEASPDVQRSPAVQGIVQQRARVERTLAELSASLLPAHPRMLQLNAELAGLKRQLAAEVGRMVDSLEREAKVAALREETVKKRLDEMSQRVVATGGEEVKLKDQESRVKAKRAQLEALRATAQEAEARVGSQAVQVEAEVLQKARASNVPTFPKKVPLTLLSMAASMLFGFIFIVTREALPGRRSGGSDPQARGAAPVGRTGSGAVTASAAAAASASAARVTAATQPAVALRRELETAAAGASADNAPNGERFATLSNVMQIARHLTQRASTQGGFRSLVVGESDAIHHGDEAARLATQLAEEGRKVLLIDWSRTGIGCTEELGLALTPGLTELLGGEASFEDVIQRMPGSDAHVISCGKAQGHPDAELDADRLNLVLDALDEAYDHILVTGERKAARTLFQSIQGRFDAGILVAAGPIRAFSADAAPGHFLGFEVADIEVVRFERQGSAPARGRKMQLARSEARA